MTLIPPPNQLDGDKLEALRRLDHYRQWHSLDEKRYCIVCGNIITGRGIRVTGDTQEGGSLRASCPTDDCPSIPMDWVRPTDEVLANQVASPNMRAVLNRPGEENLEVAPPVLN